MDVPFSEPPTKNIQFLCHLNERNLVAANIVHQLASKKDLTIDNVQDCAAELLEMLDYLYTERMPQVTLDTDVPARHGRGRVPMPPALRDQMLADVRAQSSQNSAVGSNIVACCVDTAVTSTFIYRVGLMGAIYYNSGNRWPVGLNQTLEHVYKMGQLCMPLHRSHSDFSELKYLIPEIKSIQTALVVSVIKEQAERGNRLPSIRASLERKEIAASVIDAAVNQLYPDNSGVPTQVARTIRGKLTRRPFSHDRSAV